MTTTRPATPQAMFTKIAPRYDLVNTVMTLGGDTRLRREAVRLLRLEADARVLDLAAGTAAIATALAAEYRFPLAYVGVDLNEQMLEVAERKLTRLRREHPRGSWDSMRGSAEDVIFDSSSFDAVTMCFALDDMDDPAAALAETVRVLRPGGRFLLIELAMPDNPVLLAMMKLRLAVTRRIAGLFGLDPVAHMTEEVASDRGADYTISRCVNAGLTLETEARYHGGLVRAYVFGK
ncbi:class I SAM-dependent methyltransferase [Nocardia sp. CDC160]|uniref:class I SAM-dependent methyltransferase n=1 Tax=Nocardia sp. CDC160 TaxID=3112166 RepID=UPI002DB5FED2|nr:class I SAM-dependent methyltransferase [Nocardia sp. CDC160]MEC3919973.1 class I SAM-dependent methyltransferase [Nocardia sp. CDC160]